MSGILRPLGFAPGSQAEKDWHNTLAAAILAGPCQVCGLEPLGHAADTVAAGNAPHRHVAGVAR